MSHSTTATHDTTDLEVEPVEHLPATTCGVADRPPVGGLATYYRLRCLALEAAVASLKAERDRAQRRTQEIITRYEEILDRRECADEVTVTNPG